MNNDYIVEILKGYLAQVLEVTKEEINENDNFFKIGVSSVQALKIINRMRKELEIEISPVAMFEYNSIAEISNYLYECIEEKERKNRIS